MKGQMFILTMVFLIGLIFSVQTLLLNYNYMDLSQLPQDTDVNALISLLSAIQDTVKETEFCSDVSGNLDELSTVIETGMLANYDIVVSYNIICSNWQNQYPDPPPVYADIGITGERTETLATLPFYHNVTEPYLEEGVLECILVYGGCGPSYTDIIHLYGSNNSHGELPGYSFFEYNICCREESGSLISNLCQDDYEVIMHLSNYTNAHAELSNGIYFSYDVCISSSEGEIECGYDTSCINHDTCVASFDTEVASNQSELHIGGCGIDAHETLVCCSFDF